MLYFKELKAFLVLKINNISFFIASIFVYIKNLDFIFFNFYYKLQKLL